MFERILVPLDGSELAEAILPDVGRLLDGEKAEVVLLRVMEVHPHEFTLDFPYALNEARQYVERIAERLTRGGVTARGLLRLGEAAGTILDVAREERASVIALTSHGRSGLSRWALGSVAEKVLRASTVPLLLIRCVRDGSLAAPDGPFTRILAPLDGSASSSGVMSAVSEVARRSKARVTLFHVLDAAEGMLTEEAGRRLAAAEADLALAGVPSETKIGRGNPAVEILKTAEDVRADLVVMAAHGRSGVSRWVLGSVTEKVLRASGVPVLIIREVPAPALVAEAAEASWKE